MTLSHRLFLLTLPLLCFGNLGVLGQSTPIDDPTAFPPTVIPSQPPSDSDSPSPAVQSQAFNNFPTPTRIPTYPPTPLPTTVPTAMAQDPTVAASPFMPPSDQFTALSSIPITSFPAVRTTPPKSMQSLSATQVPTAQPSEVPASATTLPVIPRGSPSPSKLPSQQFTMPTLALTSLPVITSPPNVPQRCQLTFSNKLDDLRVTDYDLWTYRTSAPQQLADFCAVTLDRITNVDIKANSSGNLVLRFTIEQGWPVYIAEALQKLKDRLDTDHLKLATQPLMSPVAVYWTDNGPCPNLTCVNSGTCDVTLSGVYTCSCDASHTGPRCQDNVRAVPGPDLRLLALLLLLIIPIVIAVIVGFIFGRRRQEKQQLKKAFDLRDVRTIGPKSMLSLPMDSGIRNQMYDTRSFALAFTDTTFSKSSSSPTPSAKDDSAPSEEGF